MSTPTKKKAGAVESKWSKRLRSALREVADDKRAPAMQAYMKSEMPFLGVPAPKLRAVTKVVFLDYPFESAEAWRFDVLAIWNAARFREERYAAIELSGDRRARRFQDMEAVPMYEHMIVSGGWWDLVDVIASNRLGPILEKHPTPMKRLMLAWSRDTNLWKRRSAIICQLGFKAETDLDLLYRCIEPALGEKEFFLRKAIGWALRQYAWTNPGEVRRYVRENDARLAGLSKREALKNVS